MLKIKSYFFCKIFTPESYERCLDRILNNPNDVYLDCLHIDKKLSATEASCYLRLDLQHIVKLSLKYIFDKMDN